MGMFDTFEPSPEVACSWCGGRLVTCQGKEGPNSLLIWRQHDRYPRQDPTVAAESLLDNARLESFVLPQEFHFLGFCEKDETTQLVGHCTDGVWDRTEVVVDSPQT